MMGAMKSAPTFSIGVVDHNLPEVLPEITEEDEQRFWRVVSDKLAPEERERIVNPEKTYPRQSEVLAVHWHPEFVDLELIAQRLKKLFPDCRQELIIPTQHNELLSYEGYSGVEVDCYSSGFNRKVQLLIHFNQRRLGEAPVFRKILEHTFKYRSSQLYSFMEALTRPRRDWVEKAARETGISDDLIEFTTRHVEKIEQLIDRFYDRLPPAAIKNKLLRNYFFDLGTELDEVVVVRIQAFLRALKGIVKENFSLKFFYRTTEIIEEARSLGAGVVIPHPEQFWPILLADYDVDGYEIWNPQSREYTEFLISVLNRRNQESGRRRRLLAFMGDDTHFGEKAKKPEERKKEKGLREIGFQPAWDDLSIRKELIKAGLDRAQVMSEYRSRLDG